jgi:hypothetical protein
VRFSDVVSVGWGGFIGKHWGNIINDEKQPQVVSSSNIGDYRGLQVALRIEL